MTAGAPRASCALGVDGAGRHGWVGVLVGADGFVAAEVAPRLADLVAAADQRAPAPVQAIGVDMPIGLVDGPRRSADTAARAFVGARRASVFAAPHRSIVDYTDHARANAHLDGLGLPRVSAQAMGLLPRIRAVAAVAAADDRLFEAFPEASFRLLAGRDLSRAKKTAGGALQRLALLAAADPPIVLPSDPEELGPAAAVGLDDLFDAAAVAWTAWRRAGGQAFALGDPDEVDPDTGRRVAVWV